MCRACEYGHLEIVKLLIDNGATNLQGAINNACLSGHLEIVKFVINKTTKDDIVLNNALYYACLSGSNETILFLINNGANFERQNTTLNFDTIYYLLQKGISPDKLKKYNDTVIKCQEFKKEFSNTINELFIKDVANLLVEF